MGKALRAEGDGLATIDLHGTNAACFPTRFAVPLKRAWRRRRPLERRLGKVLPLRWGETGERLPKPLRNTKRARHVNSGSGVITSSLNIVWCPLFIDRPTA